MVVGSALGSNVGVVVGSALGSNVGVVVGSALGSREDDKKMRNYTD